MTVSPTAFENERAHSATCISTPEGIDDTLETALWFAQYGIPVLPVLTHGDSAKAPVGSLATRGVHSATTDVKTITSWFAGASHGLAATTGTLPDGRVFAVLDGDSAAAADMLTAMFGAPTAYTAGRMSGKHAGGAHWYVILPGAFPTLSKKAATAQYDIDLLGVHGRVGDYAVAPPTMIDNANSYVWNPDGGIYIVNEAHPVIAWLHTVVAETARPEPKPRSVTADVENANLNEWMRDTEWASLLADDKWDDTGRSDTCGCPIFTHPWGASGDKSATAHEEGCPKSNSEFPGGALHCWSSNAAARCGGDSVSKYMYVANVRHGGDYATARQEEGIADEVGGSALDVDDIVAGVLEKKAAASPTAPVTPAASNTNGNNGGIVLPPSWGTPTITTGIHIDDAPEAPAETPAAGAPAPLPTPPIAPAMGGVISPCINTGAIATRVIVTSSTPGAHDAAHIAHINGAIAAARDYTLPSNVTVTEDGKIVGFDGRAREAETTVHLEKMRRLDAVFWTATPELTAVHNGAVGKPFSPWAVLGNVIARLLLDVPPNVILPTSDGAVPTVREEGGSLNSFFFIVGGSSHGKGESGKRAIGMLASRKRHKEVNSATPQGLFKVYMKTVKKTVDGISITVPQWYLDRCLMKTAEVGRFTSELDRKGSSMDTTLTSMYMAEPVGTTTTDEDTRTDLPMHMYRFSMCIDAQPGECAAVFERTGVGLPQRIVWLPAKKDYRIALIPTAAPMTELPPHPMPWDVQIGGLDALMVTEHPPSEGSNAYVMPWAPACVTEMKRLAAENEEAQITTSLVECAVAAAEKSEESLNGHLLFARIKIAAALAIMHGRSAPTDLDWYLSGVVAEVSLMTRRLVTEASTAVGSTANSGRGFQQAETKIAAELATADIKEGFVRDATDMIVDRWTQPKYATQSLTVSDVRKTFIPSRKPFRKGDFVNKAIDGLVTAGFLITDGETRYRLNPDYGKGVA